MTGVLLAAVVLLALSTAHHWCRAKRERERAEAMTAECLRLAAIANAEVTAHEQTKADLKQGGWVRVPTDGEIEAGVWR